LNKLRVTLRPVADLVPYARNSRTHSESQIEAICLSLKEFGWTNPGPRSSVCSRCRVSNWRTCRRSSDVVYQWHPAGATSVKHFEALVEAGFEIRMQIIWAKQQFPIGRGNYHVQHEPCWYAVRKGKTARWHGDRTQSTLWQIDKPHRSETGHSAQKPIECMRRPIENNSRPGDAVYDPFLGSGTTLIAAEMTGRTCYGLEIAPAYVDVTIERWQKFTGQKATLNGRTYAEVQDARFSPDKNMAASVEYAYENIRERIAAG
jgi:DNA methylase